VIIRNHASIRFLERIFKIKRPTLKQINDGRRLLQKDLEGVVITSKHCRIPLPSFKAVGIFTDGGLVTVIKKS